MRPARILPVLFLPLLLLTGCGSVPTGLLYTHVVHPLDINMNRTPTVFNEKEGDVKHIELRSIGIEWDKNAIGAVAKEHGMQEVYFADMETLRIFLLLGGWRRETVHIYGQ